MKTMGHELFPFSPPESRPARNLRRWRSFLRFANALRTAFFTCFLLSGLMVCITFYSSSRRLQDWHLSSYVHLEHADSDETPLIHPKLATFLPNPTPESIVPNNPPPPSLSSPVSDILSLEQIRDIVAPTRGFFSRDYSLVLGWNNVRYIIETALLQAELLNRTLVIPSFVYARACEYDITVCADYATMVNRGDALGSDEWRELPIEQQMGFRIPISLIVNMTHLRNRQPVITISEYLRLHGQDPEKESSNGTWSRELYHTHANVFATNKTKTPSLFVIENHWYKPKGTTRVDYIPEAMKRRGNLERHPGPHNYDGSTEYWPPVDPTDLSRRLEDAQHSLNSPMDWDATKRVLVNSPDLIGDTKLDDDQVVLELLNAHDGWEVLHTFPTVGYYLAKVIVGSLKQVVPRSSIRGFKDDYDDVDADVVVLAGETHINTEPGAMVFTEEISRKRYASKVVHSLVPPQKILDLAEVLSSRMRVFTEGRMWMGAHMRRGDFVDLRWTLQADPEDHIRHVKQRLQEGQSTLVDLHNHSSWTTWDVEDVEPYSEQIRLQPPRAEDPFFVATDERDPDTLRKFAAAGAVFMSDLLTMEDRQAFGWPLIIADVMALVEQQVLVHSSFFYGNRLSSFSGTLMNMRTARGADPRTTLLDS